VRVRRLERGRKDDLESKGGEIMEVVVVFSYVRYMWMNFVDEEVSWW
jgi:hypothetical protein